jgi:NTP pyrophosphatase (non-canonical NTP hydrolase)
VLTQIGNKMSEELYRVVAKLHEDNVMHIRHGFRLKDRSVSDEMDHLLSEVEELRKELDDKNKKQIIEEAADILGIIYHMLYMSGISLDTVSKFAINKLQDIFVDELDFKPAGYLESEADTVVDIPKPKLIKEGYNGKVTVPTAWRDLIYRFMKLSFNNRIEMIRDLGTEVNPAIKGDRDRMKKVFIATLSKKLDKDISGFRTLLENYEIVDSIESV